MIIIESSIVDITTLIGIPVEDEKSSVIGKVVDFIINLSDGRLLVVCIKPTKNPLIEKFPRDEEGIVLIPCPVIKSIDVNNKASLTISEAKVRVFLIKKKATEDKNDSILSDTPDDT